MRGRILIMVGSALLLDGCFKEISSFDFVDAGNHDDGGVEDDCPGRCVPLGPPEWMERPILIWIGEEAEMPGCPPSAPNESPLGYENILQSSGACEACSCDDPRCEMPPGLEASSAPLCTGPIVSPYDAPADWDGACVSPGAILADQLGSLLLEPPTVSNCAPQAPLVPAPAKLDPPTWSKHVIGCQGAPRGTCAYPGELCAPAAEAPFDGFRQCIEYLFEGDIESTECPETYPERHVFYSGFTDNRSCTPCECGPPVGADCSALVSVYQNDACQNAFNATVVSLSGALCVDTAAGMEIKSMSAKLFTNQPGKCEPSGGQLVGSLTLDKPRLYCCLLSP
jgi:hypothetical protein